MAAEYITDRGVTRCRQVTRSVNANGILVEVWGDFLPLTYCGFDGRVAGGNKARLMHLHNQTGQVNQDNLDKPLDLGDYVITETDQNQQHQDQKKEDKYLGLGLWGFLGLLAGIAVVVFLVFKK